MSLARYRQKRNFARTSEPRGKPARPRPAGIFVVHKHAARRLHYDLRLELDGVLKSWAVPKGPSLAPHDRRLAVHVEDHPLEYRDFEGVIPKGEYGGGPVVLWDRGRWYPEGDPRAGYRRGKLSFRLDGQKLHGGFTLVRMHEQKQSDKDNWLLIKETDDEAAGDGDRLVRTRPESVASGRTLEQVAAGEPPQTDSKPGPLPATVAPALATLVDRIPDDDRWLHEIKFDGYRLLARVDGDDVKLITRGDQDWTARLAPIADAFRKRLAGRRALVDGELVHLDADGVSRFGPLQRALADGRPGALFYYAFDLLHLDGRDLRPLPLTRRKQALAELLPATATDSRIRLSQHIEGRGEEILARVCELGLEGLIAKKRDAPYRSGRTRDWLKIKCGRRQEVVVGGYTPARSGPRAIGALLVGVFDDSGELRYCGKVGTGFDHDEAVRLHDLLTARAIPRSPFAGKLPGPVARSRFVRPEIVVEVRFSEWTADHHMRHPVYEGIREDKKPQAVRREQASPATPRGAVQVLGVPLTHPDRVLFPEAGITKRDLAEYYEKVARWILPHVQDRPLSLVRCPDGVGRPCFFQRHLRHELPDGVETADLDPDEETAYVYVRDARGLVGLAQFGVLELHVWGSTVADPDRPDRLVLDLDPAEDVPWDRLKQAAKAVRDRLAELDLASFLKTTGGKGLHVVVPLTGAHDWPTVKRFARAVADEFARREPDQYVAVASKARRKGKIYIDYLRNDRSATSIAAYSPRARPGAPVSTPLRWSELARLESSRAYDLHNILDRLARLRSDPWRALTTTRQALTPAMLRELGAK